MKDIKPIIKKLKDYIEKTEYWAYEDGLVLGSDEAQQLIEAFEQKDKMNEPCVNCCITSIIDEDGYCYACGALQD